MVLASPPQYSTLRLSWLDEEGHVLLVELNRPGKRNAINSVMWTELRECFTALQSLPTLRVVLLTGGDSASFCGGIDISDFGSFREPGADPARSGLRIRRKVMEMQRSFDAMEALSVPVVACVHGACVGAGVDMVTACDIRWASSDALFCVKEVDVGLAADVGTLARLPKVIGSASLVSELALTARTMGAAEALQAGLVSCVAQDRAQLLTRGKQLAALVASKSPLAVAGTKHNLLYARDHSVAEANSHVALWSASCLQTEDIAVAVAGRGATFSKL